MTNRSQTAATHLASRLKAKASDLVTFDRDGDTLADLSATIGATVHDDIGPDGMPLLKHSVDFIVTAADLILSEAATEPAKGDVVTWEGRTYEVQPFGPKRAAWRFCDSHQVLLRMHTIQTG